MADGPDQANADRAGVSPSLLSPMKPSDFVTRLRRRVS